MTQRPPCFCRERGVRCDEQGCELAPPGVPYDITRHCRVCHLYHHDPRYRQAWGGPLPPPGTPQAPTPAGGPGTELKVLLAQLGITAGPACGCEQRAAAMDVWGVGGCRERRDEIAGWLHEQAGQWGWAAALTAAALAVVNGVAFRINPADLYGSLVDEAIRRAEVNRPAPPAGGSVPSPPPPGPEPRP